MEKGEQGGSKGREEGGTKNCFSESLLPTFSYLTSKIHLADIYVYITYLLHIYNTYKLSDRYSWKSYEDYAMVSFVTCCFQTSLE
jgi:hypothetical protein